MVMLCCLAGAALAAAVAILILLGFLYDPAFTKRPDAERETLREAGPRPPQRSRGRRGESIAPGRRDVES